MKLSICRSEVFYIALFSVFCSVCFANAEPKKVLFMEDFERYESGMEKVATITSSLNGMVIEESFHPATGRDGERIYRLAEFIPRENPNMKASAYFCSSSFAAAGKVKISFWVKTKDASLRLYLVPSGQKTKQDAMLIFEGSTVITGDINEGWKFIEKEVMLPSGVREVKLDARLISRTVNGLLYAEIDDIKVKRQEN